MHFNVEALITQFGGEINLKLGKKRYDKALDKSFYTFFCFVDILNPVKMSFKTSLKGKEKGGLIQDLKKDTYACGGT